MPETRTPRVHHLCILALAVEWIIFGSCHFTFRAATEAEIPAFIHFGRTFIVVTTGMIEVATGIFILLPKTRKWAALASLVLLFIYLPSIHHMLASDAAFPADSSEVWRNFVRVLLVPNHIFLALSAAHLWYSQESSAITAAQVLEGVLSYQRPPSLRAGTSTIASVMLLANLAGFLDIWESPKPHSVAYLWGIMCLATGALVGFLFGIPRVNPEVEPASALRPNSNIEVVSDWLTKMIVGVGLVEFRNIGQFLNRISLELGQALPPQTGGASFAKALIVYFFVAGIIQGYLLTRMYVGRQLAENG
jgi:uncharacterized membrane protein